ncbi:hypothetical protein QVD17_11595 [Tagetes erecta]|uniref:Uncharacterized protein n=1 Tax=Tagetes erecta TaxID=13708 RepID=A0AAD8KY97_TARER|nr:hypothetical protein QVD17_11595 [Tagetes erecta]
MDYISRKKDEFDDDDQRQYLCISKYDKIVNQFDELMNMVDMVTKAPKRRRGSSSKARSKPMHENGRRSVKLPKGGGKESGIEESTTVSSTQGGDNRTGAEKLVQLITNHLLDLKDPPP